MPRPLLLSGISSPGSLRFSTSLSMMPFRTRSIQQHRPGAEQAPGLGFQAVPPGGGCSVKSGRLQLKKTAPASSARAQRRAQGGQGGALGPGQQRKGQGRDEGRRPVPARCRQPCCAPVWPPRAQLRRAGNKARGGEGGAGGAVRPVGGIPGPELRGSGPWSRWGCPWEDQRHK